MRPPYGGKLQGPLGDTLYKKFISISPALSPTSLHVIKSDRVNICE